MLTPTSIIMGTTTSIPMSIITTTHTRTLTTIIHLTAAAT